MRRASTVVRVTSPLTDSRRRARSALANAPAAALSATECFTLATDALPTPGVDHVLRYEWRARLLRDRGEIDRIITFADHFVPAVATLERRRPADFVSTRA